MNGGRSLDKQTEKYIDVSSVYVEVTLNIYGMKYAMKIELNDELLSNPDSRHKSYFHCLRGVEDTLSSEMKLPASRLRKNMNKEYERKV